MVISLEMTKGTNSQDNINKVEKIGTMLETNEV